MDQFQSDIVIVGGGLAGIVTALELLDRGKKVLILDRDDEANFGGLAKESFGGIFVVDSDEQRRVGAKDTVELALADWRSFADFGPQDHWPQKWAETYVGRCRADIYHWLKSKGITFFPVPNWVERGLYVPGNSVPRFHMVWGTGHVLATTLIGHLLNHPKRDQLRLVFGKRVEAIDVRAGRVVGCHGVDERDGMPFSATGEVTVVATGGINGSDAMLRRHWHKDWSRPPETILNGSHRFADGTVHAAAERAGARLTHLDRMWNYAAGIHHPRPRKPRHGLSLVPPRSALWLDWRGRRFGPMPLVSGFDTRELVTRICATERQYSWTLLNRRIAMKELAVSGAEFNPSIRDKKRFKFLRDVLFGNSWLYDDLTRNCQDFVLADNLNELVDKMNRLQGDDGVKFEDVKAAVAAYDAQVERGETFRNDEQFRRLDYLRRYRGDKVRIAKPGKIDDPDARPLVAIRTYIISRKSLGGIQTDLSSRAIGGDGAPLPGLYAVGEAAGFGGGGVHGLRALEGTFLGGCILTGRIAGRAIGGESAP